MGLLSRALRIPRRKIVLRGTDHENVRAYTSGGEPITGAALQYIRQSLQYDEAGNLTAGTLIREVRNVTWRND